MFSAKDLVPVYRKVSNTILSFKSQHEAIDLNRFFPLFPELAEQAIDAMLDLCENSSVETRKQAIKDLPTLCRDQQSKNLPRPRLLTCSPSCCSP